MLGQKNENEGKAGLGQKREIEGEKRGLVLNFYVFENFTQSNKNHANKSMMHKHLSLLKLFKGYLNI
jgi:hypothetical protein